MVQHFVAYNLILRTLCASELSVVFNFKEYFAYIIIVFT